DRVDVMVRRGRDQPDAGRRVTDFSDVLVDLVAAERAAFAGLSALGHLDLKLIRVDEILHRHAKPARRDLLDRAAAERSIRVRLEAPRIFAALAGVRLPADAVHRDREIL